MSCLVIHRYSTQRTLHRASETSALFRSRDPTPGFNSFQNDPLESEADNGNHIKSRNNSQETLHSSRDPLYDEYTAPELTQIIVLLFVILCSLFINFAVCLWRTMSDEVTGVYIELRFIEVSLLRGQILIMFLMFGCDTTSFIQGVFARIRRVLVKFQQERNINQLLKWDELPPETKSACEKFCSDHLYRCYNDIAMDFWWVSKDYRHCFTGQDFVKWVVENNAVEDRTEGVFLGNELISGQVLKQMNNAQFFRDDSALLYCFNMSIVQTFLQ